ncbi:MAG: nicotinate (nicotinamide) nucleotide adenylyltransferase [Bacteroidota bacterium]|nr:nicotinate (nicotinamide) nucleotide adenylyltransferase [Bacteroidota bacterium]
MKIGLFFGSFNPFHLGHKMVASYMAEFTDLDQVWIVVSKLSPSKEEEELLDAHHRLMIIRIEEEDNNKVFVSSAELNLPTPSYTVQSLNFFKKEYPNNEFVLIMGSDNLEEFHTWKNNKKILEEHVLYIYPRSGLQVSMTHKNIVVLKNCPQIEISASFIRKSIRKNKDISYLLPKKAWEYIDEMNFYRY